MTNQEKKTIHNRNLILIAALATEHALRFLPAESAVRKIIEDRLAVLRAGDPQLLRKFVAEAKRARKQRRGYTMETCLLRASEETLLLTETGRYISGGMLKPPLVAAWDAGSFVSEAARAEESRWQDSVIHLLIKRAFKEFGEPLEIPALEEFAVSTTGRES